MKIKELIYILVIISATSFDATSQTTVRERPAEWNNLVFGGRFMDRFMPMPSTGKLTSDTWGADNVKPRYTDNGIENRKYSFWGGNKVLGDDGKYHLYVCGWLESSPKGHATWPQSTVFHAVSDNLYGPFLVKDTIGKGHNPEVFRLKDGRYVIYVINGYYIANGVNGPWKYGKFEFLNRDRYERERNVGQQRQFPIQSEQNDAQYVACSHEDYLKANLNEVPDRWVKAVARLKS